LEAVIEDIGVDAVKIGMLFSKSIIETVAGFLKENKIRNVILDPVMVAKGGHRLLEDQAIEALRSELLPLALLVTPNLPEAEALTGLSAQTEQAQIQMAETLLQTCHGTVIKGGHGPSWTKTLKDFVALADGTRLWIERERVYTENTHGTGCTFSSAITAYLARGFSLLQSIEKGRDYLQGALGSGANKTIGKGHGPVDHAWNLRRHLE
jgi:hydroxymethylpyrimidine/phosphomethylpyrimidine kinase